MKSMNYQLHPYRLVLVRCPKSKHPERSIDYRNTRTRRFAMILQDPLHASDSHGKYTVNATDTIIST
jgi:hypothetical protein